MVPSTTGLWELVIVQLVGYSMVQVGQEESDIFQEAHGSLSPHRKKLDPTSRSHLLSGHSNVCIKPFAFVYYSTFHIVLLLTPSHHRSSPGLSKMTLANKEISKGVTAHLLLDTKHNVSSAKIDKQSIRSRLSFVSTR